MQSIVKPLFAAALLASSAFVAHAQSATPDTRPQAHAMAQHGRMDPAKMLEHMAARQAELKAKLKLNAAQEGAWNDYVAALQPPADMAARMSRDNRQKMHQEMQSLTTPERLDRMAAMKAERDAQMTRRAQATRNFYDVLTAEQQKVFDANTMMGGHGGKGGRHHG